jgi:Protein of unknown function (DUF3450)
MGWSRRAPAILAGAVGAVVLLLATGGDIRAQAAKAEEAKAEKSKASAQSTSPAEQYESALTQIDALTVYNAQMRSLIESQQREMASLNDQASRVEIVSRAVTPLMLKMVEALGQFVSLDMPFLLDERTKRVEDLEKAMAKADVSNAEKFRQIMEAYQIENEYGRTIDAYRSSLTVGGKEITVDFLRFGRIALVYQSLDESERGVWNKQTKSWEPLGTEYRSPIRTALRIARKQAAPDLVRLPLPAAREES